MATRRNRGLDDNDFVRQFQTLNTSGPAGEDGPTEEVSFEYEEHTSIPDEKVPLVIEEPTRIPPTLPVCLHLKCKAKIHVKVVHGDIAESGVDCIVNAAPEGLLAGRGCAGVLSRAGGENLDMDVKNYTREHGDLKTGDVAVTDGGNIACRRIIHACGPSPGTNQCQAVLVRTFDKCLEKAMDTESIAIPGVSGGLRGVATDIVAAALCQSVTEFCKAAETTPCDLKHILLVDVNESMVQGFVQALQKEVDKGSFELTNFDEEISASRRGGGFDLGQMKTTTNDVEHLPGYEGCGTITIVYSIPSGIQSATHPDPGKHYTGITRTAYLPNNGQGRKLLGLMEEAFKEELTFKIGTSHATGSSGVIVWSGKISHRTNKTGGPTKYGYPDPDYLDKLEKELADAGIKSII